MQPADEPTLYERMGGRDTFARIVHVFYQGVASDPVLKPMYPEEDLGPAEQRLLMFLEQYWGGPTTYSETRGHPRQRMRHMPFAVTAEARDRWLQHMLAGVDSVQLEPELDALLRDYLGRAAHSLVNQFDEPGSTARPLGSGGNLPLT